MYSSKRELAIFIDSLPGFKKPKIYLEQYPTDGELVATAVWDAYMRGLLGRVLDLGCGTGRFAIAAAAMGARHVVCLDLDIDAVQIAKTAGGGLSIDFVIGDAAMPPLRERFDVVFQNPPFGIWAGRGADLVFLNSAVGLGGVVYTIHKLATLDYVAQWAKRRSLSIEVLEKAVLKIKPSYPHHRKKIHRVEVFLAVVKKKLRKNYWI
ncbi:MAG: METTL5 family protein [Pyrobaculum sp.]